MRPPVRLLVLLSALAFAAAPAPAPAALRVTGTTLDGPSAAIDRLGGAEVAQDGGGALVYTKRDPVELHVFVARLVAGRWGAPVRIDPILAGDSTQPVVSVSNGGQILIAFVNGGHLFTVVRPGAAGFSSPAMLSPGPGARDPAIDSTLRGKAYLVWTAGGAGGHDVRAASYKNGVWSAVTAPLDKDPQTDAGTGAGRPRVAAAADGVAVAVWGEGGKVYARRVWDVSPSIVAPVASVDSFGGRSGGTADSPDVGVGYDDSIASVAFRQTFSTGGGGSVSRVLLRRLRGSAFDDAVAADGLDSTPGAGAERPRLALEAHGYGLLTSTGQSPYDVWVRVVPRPDPPFRIDTAPGTATPYAAPALGTGGTGVVAWQRTASGGATEIRARRYESTPTDEDPNPPPDFLGEDLLSNPALGAPAADLGLEASADRLGDIAIPFVQGPLGARRIVTAAYDEAPHRFGGTFLERYTRSRRPVLTWTPSVDLWGGVTYTVTIDGGPPATTRATAIRPTAPLRDGRHVVRMWAEDFRGQQTYAKVRIARIDATPPQIALRAPGRTAVGRPVRLAVTARDRPGRFAMPGPVGTSGVRRISVSFGDGARATVRRGSAAHTYRRPGRFRIVVTVTDWAGNVGRTARTIAVH